MLPVAEVLSVQVTDAAGYCTVAGQFESGVTPCDLPCGGDAIRSGYRFWPEARFNFPVNEYKPKVTLRRHRRRRPALRSRRKLRSPTSSETRPAHCPRIASARKVQEWMLAINELASRTRSARISG